ncbi:hypothetical protein [Weissella confusa]
MNKLYNKVYKDYQSGRLEMMIYVSELSGYRTEELIAVKDFITDKLSEMTEHQRDVLHYMNNEEGHTLDETAAYAGTHRTPPIRWRQKIVKALQDEALLDGTDVPRYTV